jgi:hypothetical protein
MLKEILKSGTLERYYGPYRNPWFLVKKKNGIYRIINVAIVINTVTVRDINLPPVADDFAEEFTGIYITFLVNFLSGYD